MSLREPNLRHHSRSREKRQQRKLQQQGGAEASVVVIGRRRALPASPSSSACARHRFEGSWGVWGNPSPFFRTRSRHPRSCRRVRGAASRLRGRLGCL